MNKEQNSHSTISKSKRQENYSKIDLSKERKEKSKMTEERLKLTVKTWLEQGPSKKCSDYKEV